MTTFQTFSSHNFLFQYGKATKFSELVDNLFDFTKFLTESKYYISVLRYVSSNDMVYFSPHALFSQARSHFIELVPQESQACTDDTLYAMEWKKFKATIMRSSKILLCTKCYSYFLYIGMTTLTHILVSFVSKGRIMYLYSKRFKPYSISQPPIHHTELYPISQPPIHHTKLYSIKPTNHLQSQNVYP